MRKTQPGAVCLQVGRKEVRIVLGLVASCHNVDHTSSNHKRRRQGGAEPPEVHRLNKVDPVDWVGVGVVGMSDVRGEGVSLLDQRM